MDQQMRSRAEWRSLFGDEAESALIASDPVLTAPFVYLRYKHKKKNCRLRFNKYTLYYVLTARQQRLFTYFIYFCSVHLFFYFIIKTF